jgi:hypothetical protein
MIKPITIEEHNILYREKDPEYSVDFLIDKINEIIEHINGEPDIDEQILKNIKAEIEKNRRSPDPDCTACNGTGVIDDPENERSYPCYCYKKKCDHPDCMFCNECDEPIDDDRSEMFENMKPAGDVCKAHLDNTDAAFENFDSRAYNIKLWTRDMRKMIKGKNISPKLKDDIRRKLNELEEI